MRISDWSSDVCSSDLGRLVAAGVDSGYDLAVARQARCREHGPARRGDLLVRAAVAADVSADTGLAAQRRSEEHTSELQSLMRISYAIFCLKKKKKTKIKE